MGYLHGFLLCIFLLLPYLQTLASLFPSDPIIPQEMEILACNDTQDNMFSLEYEFDQELEEDYCQEQCSSFHSDIDIPEKRWK